MTAITLINTLFKRYGAKNDKSLANSLNMYPSSISRVRSGEVNIGSVFILKVHEQTGIPVKEIRRLIEQEHN
jgi:hypothetical protein